MIKLKPRVVYFILLSPSLIFPQSYEVENYLNRSQGYFDSAKVVVQSDTSLYSLQTLGKIYLLEGKFFDAESVLKDAFLKNPEDTTTLRLLALTYYRSGRFTEAFELFEKLPESSEVLYYLGKIYSLKNCWDEAIEEFQKLKAESRKLKDTIWVRLAEKEIEAITGSKTFKLENLESEIVNLIKSAPCGEDYPEAGALILLKEKSLLVDENGSTTTIHRVIKILNSRGRREYGEAKIGYDDTYEYVDIDLARVIKPSGQVITVPKKFFKTTSPYSGFPLYSNYKIKIISFPEIEDGSILEYKVIKRRIKLLNTDDFYDKFKMKAGEPIIFQRYSVTYPKNRKIHIKSPEGCKPKEVKSSVPGLKTIEWEVKNQDAIIPERTMPPYDEIIPQIWVSSFKDWNEIYRWWKSLYQDRIELDESIKEKVAEIVKDASTRDEKTKAIYEWVAQNIRYVALEYGEGGFKPHKVREVFKNRYGDCKDQALLLVSMLNYMGIEAYPVLIGVNRRLLDEDIPMIQFNHAIVAAKIGDSLNFLDPTQETCSYGYLSSYNQDKICMVFFNDGYKFLKTPLFESHTNRETRDMRIVVNNDGSIDAEKKGVAYGEKCTRLRYYLKHSKPTTRKEILEQEISNFCPGGELVDYSISNLDSISLPLGIAERFRVPGWLKKVGGDRVSFRLPTVVINIQGTDKEERRYPIDYRHAESKEYNIKVELPPGMKPILLPENLFLKDEYASFSYNTKCEKSTIQIKISYNRNSVRIPKEDYKEWKSFSERVRMKLQEEIILSK